MSRPVIRAFDRVLIIVFENQYRGYVQHNVFMKQLAARGIELTEYYGVMHPSQTNYIASIAGELCNVTYDESVYEHAPKQPLSQRTIVDLLEGAGLTWKAYMQGYNPRLQPWTPNLIPDDNYPYMVKHNPFASFQGIVRNENRWSCVVDEYQFWADVVNGELPDFAWFTPNMWNDGHYVAGSRLESADPRAPQLVNQAVGWLESLFAALQFPGPNSKLPPRTLVVVTFDEAEYINPAPPAGSGTDTESTEGKVHGPNYRGPNQIYTVLLGDTIKPGTISDGFNHYSLLKTIERNFGLGTLGKNDESCNSFDFLWGERFQWGIPTATPIRTNGPLAAAACLDQLFVVSTGNQSQIQCQAWDGEAWGAPRDLGATSSGGLALAGTSDGMTLVFQSETGALSSLSYCSSQGWSGTPTELVNEPVGNFAISSLGGSDLMLVYQDADQQIQSLTFTKETWAASPIPVGQKTDGAMTLAMLGPSLFLMFKAVGAEEINVLTYNIADFNVVTINDGITNGSYNNTTRGVWSPTPFPVAQFGVSPQPTIDPLSKLPPEKLDKLKAEAKARLSPEQLTKLQDEIEAKFTPEPEPILIPSTAGQPLAAAVLDGVIHLLHPAASSDQVFEETFSLSGLMTPKLHVSPLANVPMATPTKSPKPPTTSNGFGTLAQAGWGVPQAITGIEQNSTRGMAITAIDSTLFALFQPDVTGVVQMIQGENRVTS